MSCFLFHKWGKWSVYNVTGGRLIDGKMYMGVVFAVRQRRVCERCGKAQDVWLRGED